MVKYIIRGDIMNIHESAQDYLEKILMLSKKHGQVISKDIAVAMGVTKQSVSRAMKNLRENDYIKVDSKGYITLTLKGLEEANQMYERHITIANFFKKIGVSEDIALKDACRMEHHLSDESFNAIKKLMEELDK